MNPRYPVYVISKGRWERRYTARYLERIKVPYQIVIEPQEMGLYSQVINSSKILTLPFKNLGQGSIPARNWIWDHALARGVERYWCLDDNIHNFYRLHQNQKIYVGDGTIFRCAEDFTDRFTNVALSGFQYEMFAPRRSKLPPFYLNTRIYSCILIQTDIPFRWRGRYNEDTDLSLRVLKSGRATILFNAFLAEKQRSMEGQGGNTRDLYSGDGRRMMAESLYEQHPDCVQITWKWDRWQHHVDYSRFKKNELGLKPGMPTGVNNYGLRLIDV